MARNELDPNKVGGYTKVISVTPTIEAGAYADEDVIGGKQTISLAGKTPGGTGFICGVTINAKAACAKALRIVFFKEDPSATTFTENSALALNSADYTKVLGHVDIAATDWADLGTPDICTKLNINLPFDLPAEVSSLYAVAQMQEAYTPNSTSDLTFNYCISQD